MTLGSSYFQSYARTISFAIARADFAAGRDTATTTNFSDKRAQSHVDLIPSGPISEHRSHSSFGADQQNVI